MLGSQDTATATLPFNKQDVHKAIIEVANKMKGVKISNSDEVLGRINLSTSASATSWGETLPIQLDEITSEKTQISITSKSKTGIMAGGLMTKKNEQNVELLLSNVSNHLQGKDIDMKGGSSKSIISTLIICAIFGLFGGHRFYVGKTKTGLLYLLTFGLGGIGWIIDMARILMGNFTDKDGQYISNW